VQDPVVETVAFDDLRQPSGVAAGPDGLYVVDHATGTIHERRWDGAPGRTFETGRSSLTGLAFRTGGAGTLVFVDRDANSLLELPLS
jgi:sugar lactone lactonase YvrE